MLFNSYIFFIFLGLVLPVFYVLPSKTSKNTFLVLASYFFYGYWDWRFCSLLLISTLADFFIGKILYKTEKKSKRKWLLFTSVAINLGLLGVFKYFNFFAESFDNMASIFGYHLDDLHLNIILPVGISFYTFQTLSYTIDIYRKRLSPTNNFIDFALFVSFFPQLVAGPIERAKTLLPQLGRKLAPSKEQIKAGITLIITGLFKKVMLGDTAGRIVDHIFTKPDIYSSWELICGLLLFSVQIYADFSGYSSIARGTAKLVGVELMKNFEQPYLSRNITEFWRRWHISLSSWLKDYLYISLGGNRISIKRTYINLAITMLLGGLWHGASWNFVIWGGLHGIYLAIHKFMLGEKKIPDRFVYKNAGDLLVNLLKIIGTFLIVLFTWLFFRSTDLDTTIIFLKKMIFWESSDLAFRFTKITFSFISVMIIYDFFEYYTSKHTFILSLRSGFAKVLILASLFVVTLLYMFLSDPLPFVYFQF